MADVLWVCDPVPTAGTPWAGKRVPVVMLVRGLNDESKWEFAEAPVPHFVGRSELNPAELSALEAAAAGAGTPYAILDNPTDVLDADAATALSRWAPASAGQTAGAWWSSVYRAATGNRREPSDLRAALDVKRQARGR